MATKALKEQIPLQNITSKLPADKVGTLFAVCRKLQQRLAKVEAELGNVRRDVWRIDRRAYSDPSKSSAKVSSPTINPAQAQFDPEQEWLISILKEV